MLKDIQAKRTHKDSRLRAKTGSGSPSGERGPQKPWPVSSGQGTLTGTAMPEMQAWVQLAKTGSWSHVDLFLNRKTPGISRSHRKDKLVKAMDRLVTPTAYRNTGCHK